jgi:hypothetical protein
LIDSEADLIATQTVIDRLLDAKTLTPEEKDYLNLLGMLVYEYEEKHVSIPDLHGVELLKALYEYCIIDRVIVRLKTEFYKVVYPNKFQVRNWLPLPQYYFEHR